MDEETYIDSLIEEIAGLRKDIAAYKIEIDRLTEQRDEARWEICGFHHLTGFLAGDYAISRGWNYFNDERKWQKFPPSVGDFDKFLKAQSELQEDAISRLRGEISELNKIRGKGEEAWFVRVKRIDGSGEMLHTDDVTGDLLVYSDLEYAKRDFGHMVLEWINDSPSQWRGSSIYYDVFINRMRFK